MLKNTGGKIHMLSEAQLFNASTLKIIEDADLEISYAQAALSQLFDDGLTSEQHNEARKYIYQPKAENGDAFSQYWIALIAVTYDKDATKAEYWFNKSAEQDFTESMFELALRYGETYNDPQFISSANTVAFGFDPNKEYYWLEKGANLGCQKCQYQFAELHKDKKDYNLAVFWYNEALNGSNISYVIRSYYELASIYGNEEITHLYNIDLQIDCLSQILVAKQNNIYDIDSYDEHRYESAAFNLGCVYKKKYLQSSDETSLILSIYCFSIAYFRGNTFALSQIESLPYSPNQQEWEMWNADANNMLFNPPNNKKSELEHSIKNETYEPKTFKSSEHINKNPPKNSLRLIILGLCITAVLYAVILAFFKPNFKKPEQPSTTQNSFVEQTSEEEDYNYNEYNYVLPDNIDYPYEFCDYEPYNVSVGEDVLPLREEAGSESNKIADLSNNSLVYVIGKSKTYANWALVYSRYLDLYGWVNSDYLSKVKTFESEIDYYDNYVYINEIYYYLEEIDSYDDTINSELGVVLRCGPTKESERIVRMEHGDSVTVIGHYSEDSSWSYVEYYDGINTYFGFANNNYFETTFNSNPNNVATEDGPIYKRMMIEAINNNEKSIPNIDSNEYLSTNVDFLSYSGNLTESSQEDSYEFVAPTSGKYTCQIKNLQNGFKVSIFIYTSDGYTVNSYRGAANNDTVSGDLEKGKAYKVLVKSYSGLGTYDLTIGQQKETVDISDYNLIQDSIQYSSQQNTYEYTPKHSGLHRFYISKANNGVKVSIFIYNRDGYTVGSFRGAAQGDGVSVNLSHEESYNIVVSDYSGLDNYTLSIGSQKEVVDLSAYNVINDSTQFSEQENIYLYTPKISGKHRLQLSQINSGVKLSFFVYDSSGYTTGSLRGAAQGDGVTVNLTNGETYKFVIKQYSGTGTYKINIGAQKPMNDISSYSAITDKIEFIDQSNIYTLTPAQSYSYTLRLDEMPEDVKVSIFVYDSAGYTVNSYRGMQNLNTMTLDLTEDETYSINVLYYSGFGEYTLYLE